MSDLPLIVLCQSTSQLCYCLIDLFFTVCLHQDLAVCLPFTFCVSCFPCSCVSCLFSSVCLCFVTRTWGHVALHLPGTFNCKSLAPPVPCSIWTPALHMIFVRSSVCPSGIRTVTLYVKFSLALVLFCLLCFSCVQEAISADSSAISFSSYRP